MVRLAKGPGILGILVVIACLVGAQGRGAEPGGAGGAITTGPVTNITETVTTGPQDGAAANRAVILDSTIVQREGDTLCLLNTIVRVPGTQEVRHVDVGFKLTVDKEGKVQVEKVGTTATTLVGVDALVAGVYAGDNKVPYELKGPAFDVDMRATWSIAGKNFNGTVVAGPVAGHPQIGTVKGAEGLAAAGAYGLVNHNQAFAGFVNSARTLVNLRQVGDTLVITAYAAGAGGKYEQTGTVVLKRQ